MNAKRIFFAAIFLTLLTSACQSGRNQSDQAIVETQLVESMGDAKEEMERPAEAEPGSFAPADAYPASAPISGAGAPSAAGRMVIKDAQISVLVADTDRAIERIHSLAADYGGYLISSESWYEGEYKSANMSLAVPVLEFENVLNHLRGLGEKVLTETASGQDVSAEYVDLQSRLTNLEATSARVRGFLEAAETVEEALQVNNQLAQLEAQIEQVKGQMRYYEGRSAYSTISVGIEQVRPVPSPIAPANWNPSETFAEASEVLIDLAKSAVDTAIWALVLGGPLALLVGGAWILLRLANSRLRGRKSADQV